MADVGASRDVEAEGGVGGEALGVHSVQDGDSGVDVVVELDVVLALVGPQESSDVLDDSSLDGEWDTRNLCGRTPAVERGVRLDPTRRCTNDVPPIRGHQGPAGT
jgi:hypothetical protein